MRTFKRTINDIEFDGGDVALDFVNSLKSRFENPITEYLVEPEDWLIWVQRQDLEDTAWLELASASVSRSPEHVLAAVEEIKDSRDVIYAVLKAVVDGEQASAEVLERYQELLSRYFSNLRLELEGTSFTERVGGESDDLRRPLMKVIKASYDILSSQRLEKLKECGNCGWLFLDESKNNRRKWCNMKTCGTSAKMKKYYRRKKGGV